MPDQKNHVALQNNSDPFQLLGGVYSVNVAGAIAVGSFIELQGLVNGGWTSDLNPRLRFNSGDSGGTRQTGALPAGSYRWSVPPSSGHNVNTAMVRIN